jgi:MFS transporter, Spinster family, sphingosine-1-phosphate transporter
MYLTDKRSSHMHEPLQLQDLARNVPYLWVVVSGVLATFSAAAFVSWGVEFVIRYTEYNLRDASLILGITLMVAGVLGVYLGSSIADKIQAKYAWGRSIIVAISLMAAAPIMFLGLRSTGQGVLFFWYFFLGTIFLSVYHGPATAVLHDVVPKHIRSSAFGVYVLFLHLIGSSLAPAVIGAVSDKRDLRFGLEMSTIPVFLAGLSFLVVAYYIRKHRVVFREEEGMVLQEAAQ